MKEQLSKIKKILEAHNLKKEEIRRRWLFNETQINLFTQVEREETLNQLIPVLEEILNIDSNGLPFSTEQYENIVSEAEQKLDELPFGSAEWQRHYGFIEGLKKIKFYTKTNNAIQD